MLFDQLSSDVIKHGLISKFQFSLGFKLLTAVLNSKKPLKLDFETKELDYTPLTKAKLLKRQWAEFQNWADTHSYPRSDISEIAQAYVKSSSTPVYSSGDDAIARRAKISGKSLDFLKEQANSQQEIAQAKLNEKVHTLLSELHDIQNYANRFYEEDAGTIEIDDIISDSWVTENYPKVVKSQVAYWSRYNNWDDAEVILIEEDQKLIEASKA